jgi:hypothetical protein
MLRLMSLREVVGIVVSVRRASGRDFADLVYSVETRRGGKLAQWDAAVRGEGVVAP